MTARHRRVRGMASVTREVEIAWTLPDDRDVLVTVEVTAGIEEWGRCCTGEVLRITTDEAVPVELPDTLVTWDQIADLAIEAAGEGEDDEPERDDDGPMDRDEWDLGLGG